MASYDVIRAKTRDKKKFSGRGSEIMAGPNCSRRIRDNYRAFGIILTVLFLFITCDRVGIGKQAICHSTAKSVRNKQRKHPVIKKCQKEYISWSRSGVSWEKTATTTKTTFTTMVAARKPHSQRWDCVRTDSFLADLQARVMENPGIASRGAGHETFPYLGVRVPLLYVCSMRQF